MCYIVYDHDGNMDSVCGQPVAPASRQWPPGDPAGSNTGMSSSKVPLCNQAAVEHEANEWARLWEEGTEYLGSFDHEQCTAPDPLKIHIVRKAAMSFPAGTGLGGDNIAPRAINRLSDQVLLCLATLFHAIEQAGRWPTVMHLVLIVLLPKPDGGRRPIGLFPTRFRVWMRARVELARHWDSTHIFKDCYGGNGMRAQRAAWQAAFRSETAAHRGMSFAQSLLDLVKAFEKIPH